MRSGGSEYGALGPIALTQIKAEVHLGDQNHSSFDGESHEFHPPVSGNIAGQRVPRRRGLRSARENPDICAIRRFALRAVDATGLARAMILRIQTLLLPIQTLFLAAHWPLVQR
jgi:hypothetical protein